MKAIGNGLLAFCVSLVVLMMLIKISFSDEPDEIVAQSKLIMDLSALIGLAVTLITWGS